MNTEPEFSIESDSTDERTLLRLRGELDLAVYERVVAAGASALGSVLVLDLRGVTFIDSSGIRAVLVTERAVCERGGELRLILGDAAKRVFSLAGLDSHLHIIEEPTEARIDGSSHGTSADSPSARTFSSDPDPTSSIAPRTEQG